MTTFAGDSSVHLQGYDGHQEVEVPLTTPLYNNRLKALISDLNALTLETLNSDQARNPLQLKTFVIGAGLGIELKLGPVLKLKAVPRVRLVYSRDQDPIIP
jgi:hypothetical protein